ncbi:MAG: hypothetical protein JSR27_06385 [Proteobacteria bacterium]|nr:hypothetical protein [Pseudomonadota bacterium]
MIQATDPRHNPFTATRWSIVMLSSGDGQTNARDALHELARRYWYPIYVYLRSCGHPADAASAFARRFLRQLVGEPVQEQAAHAHYRSYLLAKLRAFLADKRGVPAMDDGNDPEIPTDLELRYQRDHVDAPTPEESFHRAFALQVLHRTLRRLREEARQTGHLPMYEQLEPFLAREPVSGEYEFIAQALHNRPLTVVVALKRLRQRFRELAADELADTVSSAQDLAAEQVALLDALGRMRP